MAIKKIYNVKYTDNTKKPIKVPRRVFVKDIADITLIGKRTLEYGQEFNETLLHLMESFSCPSAPADTHNPDPDSKIYGLLVNPLEGQLWYNSTTECLHVWDGTHWDEFITYNAVHGNSGFINDGEYIPIPTNQLFSISFSSVLILSNSTTIPFLSNCKCTESLGKPFN